MKDKDVLEDIKATLTLVLSQQTALIQQGERNMSVISDNIAIIVSEMQETKAGIDSALVFISGLKDQIQALHNQIQALIDAGGTTPEDLAALSTTVQELKTELDTKQAEIAAAIVSEPTP